MQNKGVHKYLCLLICILQVNFSGAQYVLSVTPTVGSTNGATRLTIQGNGFAQQSQFSFDASNPDIGNTVTLVSSTRSFPCDVEKDATVSTKITCYTRPMPEDNYMLAVKVDGVPIPTSGMCSGYPWIYSCMFYTRSYYTPSIQYITPRSGLPGTIVTLQGRIFTDVYGSNTATSSNGRNVRFLRAYMGGMPCNLLIPNSDTLYGLTLDYSSSDWGYMSCKVTGTYVGHHNLSYILDSEYGRSLPDFGVYFVSALNKLAMFQTYAEVTGVYPSQGSMLGGTLLTIRGKYFDQTDGPAMVLVGGQECTVKTVRDEAIVCATPAYEWSNMTLFPGGRGLKMEIWNETIPQRLEEALSYNSRRPGYSVQWVDSLSYVWPLELDYFVARLSGFFVPMETDNYYFRVKADDRIQLYFSKTGQPEDKVMIAYTTYWTNSFYSSPTQKSEVMRLERGKPYYIEVLHQDYSGVASIDVGFYKERSTFTARQTVDAVSEIQVITASYDVLDEIQMIAFNGWSAVTPVQEVQTVTISSNCFSLGTCDYASYGLVYGAARTGPIPVSAPAQVLQDELNALWSIKPDTVIVTMQQVDEQSEYTITFNSTRGDFQDLQYWTNGASVNITIMETTKGRADLNNFTLVWGGISSSPLPYNASVTEMTAALLAMASADCPKELLNVENSAVKYFRDYETSSTGFTGDVSMRGTRVSDTEAFCGSWSLMNPNILFNSNDVTVSGATYGPVSLQQYGTLCFAYKGYPKNVLELVFTYQGTSRVVSEITKVISVLFEPGDVWKYMCVELLSSLQISYPGSNYQLLQVRLYKDTGDYYIDTVQLGRTATVSETNVVIMKRRPPALADSGRFIQSLSVQKLTNSSDVSYKITASPYRCAFDFPLLEIGFLQKNNTSKDMLVLVQDNATVTVTRLQRASPPLNGTFSVGIFGQTVKDLSVNISADDLKYALQGIPDMGLLSVNSIASCKGSLWEINWLTKPGRQPLLQINDSGVVGVNPSVKAQVKQQGGLMKQSIMGDFLRVPTNKTQVQVFINGIPSVCSGDCGFSWNESKTPIVTGISPTQGASALGTVLTISGSGFVDENATVQIGNVRCSVIQVTNTSLTCGVGPASAGLYPISVSFPTLGNARYNGDNIFNFTYQLGVTSSAPTAGSVTGGTIITVSGYGFSQDTTATIGSVQCDVIDVNLYQLLCRAPAGSEGENAVTLQMGNIQVTSPNSFTYDTNLTATITEVSPQTTTVFGRWVLTIVGTNFGEQINGSSVLIGSAACEGQQWASTKITCLLPTLPPGLYDIKVIVGNQGSPLIRSGVNATVEYILRVTGISPQYGSLYGGTTVTITGSGFSPLLQDNQVTLGDTLCNVTAASNNQLECVTQMEKQTYTVTNQGIDPTYGRGYSWSPATVMASVGDTVVWRWQAPAFVQGLGYSVFSVDSPSSTKFDGVTFNSGNSKTANGFYSYCFTAPGVYYYSSGYINSANQISMQGVVNVRPLEERSTELNLTVAGFQALQYQDSTRLSRSASNCVASPECSVSSSQRFSLFRCSSPIVISISPNQGTYHDPIIIQGFGFSSITCAIEVLIGSTSCQVTSSTSTMIQCHLSPDSGAPVGILLPVQVKVNNLGIALLRIPSESARRFAVMPVLDSVSPSMGSTTSYTRLLLSGSGLTAGTVTVAGYPCNIVSRNYTHIICDTTPSPPQKGNVVVKVGGITSLCSSDCSFQYSSSLVPTVSSISPNSISGNQTTVFVSGSGFGSQLEDLRVYADNIVLEVKEVTDSQLRLLVGPLPAGPHTLKVIVMSKGLASGNLTLTSQAQASLQPSSGSLAGGTLLTITGNGFAAGNTSVMLGPYSCPIMTLTPAMVNCLTHAFNEIEVQVTIKVFGVIYPPLSFNYTRSQTPNITTVSPPTGPNGTAITVSGSGFGSVAGLVSVLVDGVACNILSITDTMIECTVGEHAGGTFPVTLYHQVKGYALTQANFSYALQLTQVVPNEGSYGGGAVVAVQGSGFDPNSSRVLICNTECSINQNASSATNLYCRIPANNGTQAELSCTVVVLNSYGSVNITNGYTYKTSLTPVITDVSPRRGGTAGGTLLTVTGYGFSGGNVNVTIAGSECDVQSASETQVMCVTSAQPRSQQTKVLLYVGNRGIAKMDHADFFYIDVWSSRYTWGGESPPEAGTFAVITKGQTILLDVSTPVLKMLLIQGGKLIFDEADIELQAENILITDGGALQIGTEDNPFQHKAIITLHGHLRSPELPVYGAKTLGVREGVLDLHGIPIPITWTRLAQTANNGSITLTLMDAVTWKEGDEVVIASTGGRHSQQQNEVRKIALVSPDGRTLTLTSPLNYTHLGLAITLPDGTVFEARAEIGVLTRNIVVRGSINAEWSDTIPACPDGFDTGEFATQTCFQGKFGEETGSDEFGGCIMFHAPRPGENLAIGRIEYVEIFNAGQAYRLGRYPIHWHLMGDINFKSYVRGCGIHQTYNRAVTIHNTHRLLVEHNVIYNIMGGAFFIEDGIETGNILQYNLAVFVRQSTSLLNDDVTPAGYWVTNPNNTIRHNAAAGGTHFGFWYRMHDHPDGASYDGNVCQKMVPLGEFYNNTAHSQGWFGLWIFQEFFPKNGGKCYSYIPEPAVFRKLTSWNNEKGAEWVNVGAVQFNDFLMVNNEVAGVETKRIIQQHVSGWGLASGAGLVNSTLVGHADELGLGEDYCTTRGIVLPLDDGMSVLNTKFINFDRPRCAAVGVTTIQGTSGTYSGGFAVKFSGIKYYQSPNKATFRWEHEIVLVDVDGSLTGNPDYKVVPKSNLLDPVHCSDNASWSFGFPGTVCDNTVSFHRLGIYYPLPFSLWFKDLILTNNYGSSVVPFADKLITHQYGWMALLPTDKTYNCYFRNALQLSNISYNAVFYGFKSQDYVIINHNLTQNPDQVSVVDSRNGSANPLNPSVNINGDWYMNKSSNNIYYIVSSKTTAANRKRRNSVDRSTKDISVAFKVYNCFFPNCIPPPPVTIMPLPSGQPTNFTFSGCVTKQVWNKNAWSNQSFWRSSAENNFIVPQEGANVVIPSGSWVVLDIPIPPLNKLTVMGVLEIPDNITIMSNRTNSSLPQNSSIVINATYISILGGCLIAGWPDKPFSGQLQIILRGNHRTPELRLPDGQTQGSKVLGVFGGLDLYGMPHRVYHTKLGSTAMAGSNSLSLQEPVDWQVGDEIVLSTTSYDPWQTETRTISAVSNNGLTLTVDQPLTYTHIAENYTVPGTSQTYRLAGDVGLLSRNIKIIGGDYPDLYTESFGARVLVGSVSVGGIDYTGKAQIRDVEFYHTGQEGWTDNTDPRYSVAFLNLGVVSQNDSYIKGCAFHHGFSPAIGIFGTDGLTVDDNVIHHTVGEGIRVWGNNITVRRNLVTLTLWPGAYNGRQETMNINWPAAIEANTGTNVVLQGNIVAGYERVGFRISGEPCPGSLNLVAQWQQNEAHGGLFGVYMNKDGLAGCSQIRGFAVWKSFDYGIYFQVYMSVIVSNVTLVDNGMGIMPLIYEPPSVSHEYSNKTVLIQNSLIVGSSPNFNCTDTLSTKVRNIALSAGHRAPRPLNGGRSGISWPTFESGHNGAPMNPHDGLMSYNAISGLMTVTNTTFVGFRNVCSSETNYMFITIPNNEDLQHPISVQNITKSNSTEGALVFIHHPNLGKVNPSDCVDMDCDAKKKSMLKDLDGSFLGAVGSVIPLSEYEWNGDPRHGLGDYRIPKVMLTYLNGSRIPVRNIAPYKGVIRDSTCMFMSTWQAYKCFGMNYRMLVIESLDSDTETRRLSPVAVLGDGYVDLLNGPQDHGWCAGYTCQKRVSLFHSIVATNKSFDIFFTGVSPQKLRLMMLNAAPTETVKVAVFYSKPQRLDVYVNAQLVAPNNAQWNTNKNDYTLLKPAYPEQYIPTLNGTHGSNFFDPDYKMLHVLLRGSTPVQITTASVLFISFNLPAMTEEEFFGDQLVNNLALFLKVPPSMIRITKIVREGGGARRRRSATGLTVEVEIKQPPTNQMSANSTSDSDLFTVLKTAADTLGQAAISGNLSQSIGFNVSSVGIVLPSPPASDPSWSQVANQEVTREDPSVQRASSVSTLKVVVEPVAGLYPGALSVQPVIMALDQQGDCVSVGVTSLMISAMLKDAQGNPAGGLYGNTTIPFQNCWANYTDLAINTTGMNMTLFFTLNEWKTQSRSFTVNSLATDSTTKSATVMADFTTKSATVMATTQNHKSIFDSSRAFTTHTVYIIMLLSVLHLIYLVV
ncbi:PKHD1 like 1, tandem duplicate 1 [Ictalurus furcatus]|uniref:PKHD1 like 1, tandem duplicate 1 n=1 Tax=Ictalurus furcatus TaxID=66913 RepID=UPI002350D88C|nr:PKHD1 like 1, tandem duplicate 1 [Ictalurus furcatus]